MDRGTFPLVNKYTILRSERLMTLVKTGSRVSIQATRRGIGIGSSAHDFLGMASINFRTSCSVSRVKLVLGSIEDTSGWESVLLGDTSADISSSLPWMVTIFWVKNSPNLWQEQLFPKKVDIEFHDRYQATALLPRIISSDRHSSHRWVLCKTSCAPSSWGC